LLPKKTENGQGYRRMKASSDNIWVTWTLILNKMNSWFWFCCSQLTLTNFLVSIFSPIIGYLSRGLGTIKNDQTCFMKAKQVTTKKEIPCEDFF
jgi:hypothetical protein